MWGQITPYANQPWVVRTQKKPISPKEEEPERSLSRTIPSCLGLIQSGWIKINKLISLVLQTIFVLFRTVWRSFLTWLCESKWTKRDLLEWMKLKSDFLKALQQGLLDITVVVTCAVALCYRLSCFKCFDWLRHLKVPCGMTANVTVRKINQALFFLFYRCCV